MSKAMNSSYRCPHSTCHYISAAPPDFFIRFLLAPLGLLLQSKFNQLPPSAIFHDWATHVMVLVIRFGGRMDAIRPEDNFVVRINSPNARERTSDGGRNIWLIR